jgi:hypothetical protein
VLLYNGYALNTKTTEHCNFAGDDCWSIRTHPKIEGVSASSGFTTGGQNFTISGHGLNGTDISVLVDGVACEVSYNDTDEITCITGEKSEVSALGYQPGQPGLKREKTDEDGTYSIVDLITSMEFFEVNEDEHKEQISGWFTAPASGQYRFLISCETGCNLYLDTSNPYTGTPLESKPSPSIIAKRTSSIGWRTYFYERDDGQKSEWIDLVEGEQYYIMAESTEYANIGHLTVSLEIAPTEASESETAHPKTSHTIQQLSFDQSNTFEEWSIAIASPDAGTYQINFLNPTTTPASLWQSDKISAGATAATFRATIISYYRIYFGTDVAVTLSYYDANGAATSSSSATTYEYKVKLAKVISGFSTNALSVKKVTSKSAFTATAPNKGGVQSSTPISGTYTITCEDSFGVSHSSSDISFNTEPTWITKQLD